MRQLIIFTAKELRELIRSGKLLILTIIFGLFGIMSPALAKLTPWMISLMQEQLAQQGLAITEIKVTALTSWEQYYKNVPMEMIVFVLFFFGIMINEIQRGTLINLLTKGLKRWKVILSKFLAMMIIWTLTYWLTFLICLLYTNYYWGSNGLSLIGTAAVFPYLFGVMLLAIILLGSVFFKNGTGVLLFLFLVLLVFYIPVLLPSTRNYSPFILVNSLPLLTHQALLQDYLAAGLIGISVTAVSLMISIKRFSSISL